MGNAGSLPKPNIPIILCNQGWLYNLSYYQLSHPSERHYSWQIGIFCHQYFRPLWHVTDVDKEAAKSQLGCVNIFHKDIAGQIEEMDNTVEPVLNSGKEEVDENR